RQDAEEDQEQRAGRREQDADPALRALDAEALLRAFEARRSVRAMLDRAHVRLRQKKFMALAGSLVHPPMSSLRKQGSNSQPAPADTWIPAFAGMTSRNMHLQRS